MKLFLFSLQKLLDAKEALEKASEMRMSEAQRKLNEAEVMLAQLWEQLRLQQVYHAERLRGETFDRHHATTSILFMTRLEKHIHKQEENVKKYRQKREEARDAMLKAIRERKSLENLKEREKKQWMDEVRRIDRIEMDQIAVVRFVRQERIA